MIEINLRDVLNEGQFYVAELSRKFGIDIKAVKHNLATDTCFEKAGILGWPAERIVKAIFFNKGESIYGFVFPELGERDSPQYIEKEVLAKTLSITSTQAKKFRNSYCPEGMEYGTCTPFVLEELFVNNLRDIHICNVPHLENSLVDISIGGFGEEAHRTSLHLNYKDIYSILYNKFGNRINKFNF